ncbi:hypothetical protein I3760_14G131000 [Carya illinoinensis]|nr:hypothetical protein I3760_14G131000 [Carya illinoinensis]
MSSSLEKLLAKEDFKGRRSMSRSRSSFKSDAASTLSNSFRDQRKSGSLLGHRNKTKRARSDVARHNLRRELPQHDDIRGRRSRDSLFRTVKNDEGLKQESRERLFSYLKEGKQFTSTLSNDMPQNKIEEVGKQDDEIYPNIYSKKVYSSESGNNKYSNTASEKEVHTERSGRDPKVDKRNGNNLAEQLLGHLSFDATNRKSTKKATISSGPSNRSSRPSKNFEDKQSKKRDKVVEVISKPALDEVSFQAIISIINGYIKRFLNDEDFRKTLHHNCLSSFNFIEHEEEKTTQGKVMASLEQAIEIVEITVEDSSSAKDLKKASLQLSVITGLYSNNLEDGFTSGIPNSNLSACAHLYLSVISKHLFQVFCNVRFQAQTTLLPELWDCLFSPHLLHLKEWYIQQVDSLADEQSKPRKMKLILNVYNEILDSGTYQFAIYYKNWLTLGVETPPIPGSLLGQASEPSSSNGPFSPQPMMSKKLYDVVFSHSSKPGVDKAEDSREAENIHDCMISSGGSSVIKETLTYFFETVKYMNWGDEKDLTKIELDDARLHLHGSDECFDERSCFSSIPQEFICPLTGKLFEDPVTLETGQTFGRVVIKVCFDQGNRTCRVTGKSLEFVSVPLTNFVLKRLIDNWRSEHFRHLLSFASQIMENSGRHGLQQLDETVIFILEQLLTAISEEEKRTNAKYLISRGGVHFLLQRFELGKLEEKAHVVAFLSCCIEADANCRNQIARNINKQCLLELLQSKQLKSRANAVLLWSELIHLRRWKDVTLFLSGLHNEPRKCSIYREECCQSLLIMGERFSFSGKLSTKSWILKQAGFKDIYGVYCVDNEDKNLLADDAISSLSNLSAALLSNGKKSFLDAISKCLEAGNLEMVRVCLITVALAMSES